MEMVGACGSHEEMKRAFTILVGKLETLKGCSGADD
jgi:hypothetical protein